MCMCACMCACFVEVCVIVYVCTYECLLYMVCVCLHKCIMTNTPTNYIGTTVTLHNRVYEIELKFSLVDRVYI